MNCLENIQYLIQEKVNKRKVLSGENMIRIFSKDRKELHSDVDTWIVKWKTYKSSFIGVQYPEVKECYKAFTDKNEADEYANALNDAMKLVGITSLPNAKVYKQEVNSI